MHLFLQEGRRGYNDNLESKEGLRYTVPPVFLRLVYRVLTHILGTLIYYNKDEDQTGRK